MREEPGGLIDEGEETGGIGLFEVEAIATIDLEEKRRETKASADLARGSNRLVGQNGEHSVRKSRLDCGERLGNAGVHAGVVELVKPVVAEKEGQGAGQHLLVVSVALRVTQGPTKQHGSSVADECPEQRHGERWPVEVSECCIDRVGQILFGVDQSSVEVKDDEAQSHERL